MLLSIVVANNNTIDKTHIFYLSCIYLLAYRNVTNPKRSLEDENLSSSWCIPWTTGISQRFLLRARTYQKSLRSAGGRGWLWNSCEHSPVKHVLWEPMQSSLSLQLCQLCSNLSDFHTAPKSLIKEYHKATFMQNTQHRIQDVISPNGTHRDHLKPAAVYSIKYNMQNMLYIYYVLLIFIIYQVNSFGICALSHCS